MRRTIWILLLGANLLAASVIGLQAQVVREQGASAIAGILSGPDDVNRYSFLSAGNQVLFASIDSTIYQSNGRKGGDHHEGDLLSTSSGGCSHDDTGGCSHDTGGGPPVNIKLQVVDEFGQVLCHAGRPVSPGWQRDPRLVCSIPFQPGQPLTYWLEVLTAPMSGCEDHEEHADVPPDPSRSEEIPYLLNVSLRDLADSGLSIAAATARSRSHF